MTRVAREFENLLLAVRSSVATQRPVSCELLDNLIVKTKGCFAAQKLILTRGVTYPVLISGVGTIVGMAFFKAEASTSLQFSSKVGEFVKTWFDAGGFDQQALQKQIDNAFAEVTADLQAKTNFQQGLESAMQRHQQILDNAKR